MKASDLVGKRVLRTKPVNYGPDPFGSGKDTLDYSYTSGEPITIVKVTESHIVYKSKIFGEETTNTLNGRWLDDNWVDYDLLISTEPRDVTPKKIDYKHNN